MTFLLSCLFIAVLFPYLSKLPLAYAMSQVKGGYDNHYPREQAASLDGFGARALAAHQNSFESLLIYSTAVLSALLSQKISSLTEILALLYLVARLAYHIFYLIDYASLRSLAWFISFLSCLGILLLAII